ncbi:MAG: hypothetical protein Q7S40_20750 [Opitutaceae bacterium]|nr:hypothetical protein [Opitutaceae bacterium]
MPRSTLQRVHMLASIAALLAAVPLGAANKTIDRMQENVLRMTEFFDTMLPGVLEENNMTVHFRPKLGDLRDEEYMRLPFELRYGLTSRWELYGGLTPFVPNPWNSGRDHRWGPGEIKFGARHDVGAILNFFDESTVGVETRVPWGKPPVELNDHYTHVKPYVSVARTLVRLPSATFYANVSYDRSVKLVRREAPPPEVIRRHIIEVAPGLLYRPSEFGYFAEYRFRHIAHEHDWRLGHEIQFGTIWDIPIARTEKWNLPGKWQLELAYKLGHEEGGDFDQGVSARVNWRTTLREVLAKTSGPFSKLW